MSQQRITRRRFVQDTAAGAAALAAGLSFVRVGNCEAADTSKIMNYNPDMEYRLCGKTGWMISAVCMGGHWKRITQMIGGTGIGDYGGNISRPDFQKNRYDVVNALHRSRHQLHRRLHARRDPGLQPGAQGAAGEDAPRLVVVRTPKARNAQYRVAETLVPTLDEGMKLAKEEYVDLWRITCNVDGRRGPDGKYIMTHTPAESEGIAAALDKAKKAGKARKTGVSSHDRVWLSYMIEKFPDQIDVVVTPYTAKSKVLEKDSFFQTARKCNCGFFGIKPFASNSLFKGDSSLDSPHREEDDRLARLAIRYILCNPAITAPIPGMINLHQVDNVAAGRRRSAASWTPTNRPSWTAPWTAPGPACRRITSS